VEERVATVTADDPSTDDGERPDLRGEPTEGRKEWLAASLVGRLRGHVGSRHPADRLRSIDAEVPQLLDLLAIASSAGLAAPLALRRASDALRGPLAEELQETIAAVDLGARWRDELAAAGVRLGSRDLRRAFSVLARTEALGSSLSEATAELAVDVRRRRRTETATRARTAPIRMLFPLVFLVLPAFLLLTVVPVLIATLRSIR
jgi:tight adherence protein C